MSKVTFNNTNNVFFQSLKKSVESYFSEKQIKKTGNWKLYAKTVILIPAAIIIYVCLLTIQFPAAVGVLLCALLGITLACIGFNVMHDACHGSYSDKKWMNNTLGL